MSDIGILNGPVAIAFVLLLFGSPGLPLGALAGALARLAAAPDPGRFARRRVRLSPVPTGMALFLR